MGLSTYFSAGRAASRALAPINWQDKMAARKSGLTSGLPRIGERPPGRRSPLKPNRPRRVAAGYSAGQGKSKKLRRRARKLVSRRRLQLGP
jgi:hypothetical protein